MIAKLLNRADPLARRMEEQLRALDEQSMRIERLAESARKLQRETQRRRVTLTECANFTPQAGAGETNELKRESAANAG